MSEEMFDILDQHGRKTGETAGKREVHQLGLWHAGMHLCVTDGEGNVFQQLRGGAPHVRILPDVWDLFIAAGHVSAGEEALATLLRETREEVGVRLSVGKLRKNGLSEVSVTRSDYWVVDPGFPNGGYYHRVFDHNFVVRLPDLNPDTFVLEANKVLGVRKYPARQLRQDLRSSRSSTAYRQHAHRPIEDGRLYSTVLDKVDALTIR